MLKSLSSRREKALAKASTLMREGQHALAREFFVKAVDITPQMAYQLIKVSPHHLSPQDTLGLT